MSQVIFTVLKWISKADASLFFFFCYCEILKVNVIQIARANIFRSVTAMLIMLFKLSIIIIWFNLCFYFPRGSEIQDTKIFWSRREDNILSIWCFDVVKNFLQLLDLLYIEIRTNMKVGFSIKRIYFSLIPLVQNINGV